MYWLVHKETRYIICISSSIWLFSIYVKMTILMGYMQNNGMYGLTDAWWTGRLKTLQKRVITFLYLHGTQERCSPLRTSRLIQVTIYRLPVSIQLRYLSSFSKLKIISVLFAAWLCRKKKTKTIYITTKKGFLRYNY